MTPGESAQPSQLYRIAWAFYLVVALAGVIWLGVRGELRLELFWSGERWWLDLAGAAGAAALLIGLWAVVRIFFAAARRLEDSLAAVLGQPKADEILALAVLSGIAEELLFRGAIQGAWGWVWATALFALLHTGPGREHRWWTLFAAVAGCLFAFLREWSGALLAPIVAHILVNAVNLRLWLVRRSGE